MKEALYLSFHTYPLELLLSKGRLRLFQPGVVLSQFGSGIEYEDDCDVVTLKILISTHKSFDNLEFS